MDDLFTSPTGKWTPVSPALATARKLIGLVVSAVIALLGAAVTAVLASITQGWWWVGVVIIALAVGFATWMWWWAPRNQRSWGYAETDQDLLVRGGLMFRRFVAIPYGRMQFVDVESGPIARKFGFASVSLNTASTSTAATIPGVPLDEAARLRDKLTELGESHGAGL